MTPEPSSPNHSTTWDRKVLEKYNYSGPRYTSYPTALEFREITVRDYNMACAQQPQRPLSLYIHIPFCRKLCYYCACNKIITSHSKKAIQYLAILENEIRQRAILLKGRQVAQLHFGGGTPTFLSQRQIAHLMSILRDLFQFEEKADISIELDPREIELYRIDQLYSEGFNRLSVGIQDFNKEVQKLVNREQDSEFIITMINQAKKTGFNSINLDLIYGLPKQTAVSFSETLDKVIDVQPNRISIFNYAHIPSLFAGQCRIKDEDLPIVEDKIKILQNTITILTKSGYQFIGMDHFAQPDDELAIAQRKGVLHRNFQGYTTRGECDLVGFGVSAISMIGNMYVQNQKELKKYYTQMDSVSHALYKGILLDDDDLLRRKIIQQLICNFTLDKNAIEAEFKIEFDQYFKKDLKLLQTFITDELVKIDDEKIYVTSRGRLLIRNICMCFDKYLRKKNHCERFSRVI
ncbi:oxygen-independent coproporphyrinogen-III oxidase [Candidatus Photodesmus blepharus]|uniref:Coproporphyrinogen-III oxidase n=1 Tax=Candidatus Photodesmus blepharonis TaxID=1179155 RepID=A0A084CNS7_9GAMM|nr:oxygen-independent coproporphyrinogen III oxidase [Candidatus Photodesmus blepharus]KEY91456.1 oxygen-independent coproporphyrinogen-III oxidase [Candidatus Photodesmus blepharus]